MKDKDKVYCQDCEFKSKESYYKNEFGNYEGTTYLYCKANYGNPTNLINKNGDCKQFKEFRWIFK